MTYLQGVGLRVHQNVGPEDVLFIIYIYIHTYMCLYIYTYKDILVCVYIYVHAFTLHAACRALSSVKKFVEELPCGSCCACFRKRRTDYMSKIWHGYRKDSQDRRRDMRNCIRKVQA